MVVEPDFIKQTVKDPLVADGETMDEHIGVSIRRAAEIIGTTRTRLVRWAENGVLRPRSDLMIGARRRWIYGLDELAAGRVVREIEDAGVSMSHLAWVIRRYATEAEPSPLTCMQWGLDRPARKAYVFDSDLAAWMDGDRPHQFVMPEVIDINEIRASVRGEVVRRQGQPGKIVQDRNKFGSKPVFAGTRVPVSGVMAWVEHGATDERILEAYPSLSLIDVRAARQEARRAG